MLNIGEKYRNLKQENVEYKNIEDTKNIFNK